MGKTRLFFAGDFCSTPSTGIISVDPELKELISSADFGICNFEVPLKPDNYAERKNALYQSDDAPSFLEDLGFNVFSFANNHAFDYGVEGWKKTVAAFKGSPFGSGTYDNAYKLKIVEKDGFKIAFLALSYAARTGVFDDLSDRSGFGCAWINDLKVNHVIIQAKKEVDYLVILPHDGLEYVEIPLPETIARYRDFIDYGADAVIGTHPHCPQGWERYKGRPIFYSLGNFFFNSKKSSDFHSDKLNWYNGLCAVIEISDDEVSVMPVFTHNQDNRKISLDNSPERIAMDRRVCELLSNSEEYQKYYCSTIPKIIEGAELHILDRSVHEVTLWSSFKSICKDVLLNSLGRWSRNDESLINMLKNDSRRAALLRVLHQLTQK